MKFWQVDAFSQEPFKGNPAAVYVLDQDIPDSLKIQIANEMNLSETAFILNDREKPLIRWFTPDGTEMDLCGHATMASSHIMFTEIFPDKAEITFSTVYSGDLPIRRTANGYQMDFPTRQAQETTDNADMARELLAEEPFFIGKTETRFMVIAAHEDAVRAIDLSNPVLQKLPHEGILVAAKSSTPGYDYIYRFFGAAIGIPEDPVNGSGHTLLAPYFAEILGKNTFKAYAASLRTGSVDVELSGDRTYVSGSAITVLQGDLKAA